jgi:hypothetical protein
MSGKTCYIMQSITEKIVGLVKQQSACRAEADKQAKKGRNI